LGDMHADEQVHVRHHQRQRIQLRQCPRGAFQQGIELRVEPLPFAVDRRRRKALVLILLQPLAGSELFDLHQATSISGSDASAAAGACQSRTSIWPVTAAVINAVRYCLSEKMASAILLETLSILEVSKSKNRAICFCSSKS